MTVIGAGRLELLVEADPDVVEARLHALEDPRAPMPARELPAMGGKRALMRLALQELHAAAPTPVDQVALPAGAPFGRAVVDVQGCTLCLACVGACPTGAFQSTIRSGPSCASSRMPACSAACASAPARRR